MNIGVLSVQGAFAEHRDKLEELGAGSFEIRKRSDLDRLLDGLILPGGESTVMGKLLRELHMMDALREFIAGGLPVLGTCAGMILLAKTIEGSTSSHLATMDITVVRNAYGRQLGSFSTESELLGERVPMRFIRAPFIRSVDDSVTVLAEVDGKIVAAQQKNQLAVAFHPELTGNTVVHEHFLSMVRAR